MNNPKIVPTSDDVQAELTDLRNQLRKSEDRLLDFADVTDGWLYETDSENRFVWMSDNVEKIAGVKPEWHYGKTR